MAPGDAAIMWFRRDLRLADNPALVAACAHGRVVPLFVDDPKLAGPSGPNRRAFLAGCLAALDVDLGGHLVVRRGEPSTVVPALAAEVGAADVYAAADFGPYGAARDEAVERSLATGGRRLRRVGSPYAVPPGTLRTKGGTSFRVFTPFSRSWRAHGRDRPAPPPAGPRWSADVESDGLPPSPATTASLPAPGEAAAHDRLDAFLDRVDRYAEVRDRPDLDATSRLSADLKWGTLHPRQVLDLLGDSDGARVYATEICWREFYADVLHHRPDTAHHAFDGRMAAMAVDQGPEADERFAAWCEGRTGYPIVDAGMRQLVAEGWMHNRVRMIVASFLVKDLHLDWRRGARFFMEHLVDGDLASNQHGWQWTAGTGTDAAPYFRVFNPTAQGRRFDPDGDYVRRWVPELAHLDGAAVHEPPAGHPDLFGGGTGGYPPPVVDHAEERAEALRRYDAVRGR